MPPGILYIIITIVYPISDKEVVVSIGGYAVFKYPSKAPFEGTTLEELPNLETLYKVNIQVFTLTRREKDPNMEEEEGVGENEMIGIAEGRADDDVEEENKINKHGQTR